jgi:hypothetical protein
MSQVGFSLSQISPKDTRHVRWNDSLGYKSKYEDLSLRISRVLGTDRSLKTDELDESLQQSVRRLEKVKESSALLHQEATKLSLSRGEDVLALSQARPKFIDSDEEDYSFSIRHKVKASRQLQAADVISNPEVLEFIEHHFRGKSVIKTSQFIASLEFEFPELLESSQVKQDLEEVLSLDADKHTISLNALEIFTRDKGLQASVGELAEGSIKQELNDKTELNQAILEELMQLKEMLETKSAAQEAKEQDLKDWEEQLDRREKSLVEEVAGQVEALYKQHALKIKQESTALMKRMGAMERAVSDQLKLIKAKQQLLASKEQAAFKSPLSEQLGSKNKARIQGLEKTQEFMKGRVAALEREVAQARQQVTKLTEELARAKARNAMLEQSLNDRKTRPVEISEVPKAPQSPQKEEPVKPSGEIQLSLKTLHNLLSCLRLTLPLYCQPVKSQSLSASVMSVKSSLTAADEVKGFLGEILYPSFNGVVCGFVELLPFVFKSKRPDVQLTILWTLWDVLAFTYAEESRPEGDQQFLPQMLEFNASTELWRLKLQKARGSGHALYPLFANVGVHKVLSSCLQKFIEARSKQADSRRDCMFICLAACFLTLLLSTSKKHVLGALELLQGWLGAAEQEQSVIEVVLNDLKGSAAVLIGLVSRGDVEVRIAASTLLLGLSRTHSASLIAQLQCGESAKRLCEAVKYAILEGKRAGEKSELEENLVILLEKCSYDAELQETVRENELLQVLSERVMDLPEEEFYVSNLKAIVQRV